MRISFQLNAASPLQISTFFASGGSRGGDRAGYVGETHYYFHCLEHLTSFVISDDMHGKIVIGMDGFVFIRRL